MGEPRFQPGEIIAALDRHRVPYVVIGGLAATLHGSPLVTSGRGGRGATGEDYRPYIRVAAE